MQEVISNHWGGLGDWLSVSTLPEELTRQKGCDVYLHSGALFRNNEIKQLFLMNPFIKGVIDSPPTVGDVPGLTPGYQNLIGEPGSHIANWEKLHNLTPKNIFPKIYYTPNNIPDMSGVVLVDTTSITERYDNDEVRSLVEQLKEARFSGKKLVAVNFKNKLNAPQNDRFHSGRHDTYLTSVENSVTIESIFQYCDLLASVEGFICLHSGSHALASAVKHQHNPLLQINCIIREQNMNHCKKTGLFLFLNVEYVLASV